MGNLIVRLEYDHDAECPADWKLYSFGRRHTNFVSPEKLGLGLELEADGLPKVFDKKLRTKLKNGLAHWLSYYEHGSCWWGRKDGPVPAGVEFRWDGRRVAGLLVWEHAPRELGSKTYEGRCADADRFLATYTT